MKTSIDKVINALQSKQVRLVRGFLQRNGIILQQARLGFRSDYTMVIVGERRFVVAGVCGQDDLPVEVVYEV